MDIIEQTIKRYPHLEVIKNNMYQAVDMLHTCYKQGRKILICGNGGSAADAEHIVGELMKGFLLNRSLTSEQENQIHAQYPEDATYIASNLQNAIPAISLASSISLSTAFANDVNAEFVFAQQVFGLAKPCDVLWAISTSGNSSNICRALQVARTMGVKTLGLTGVNGGRMSALCNVELRVPASETFEIQELHLPVYHAICAQLEKEIFIQ